MANFGADFMTDNKNISNYKHLVGISMGVITAFVILFTQSFYFNYVTDSKVEVKTEQADDSGETSLDLTISQDAVSSVVQININQILPYISDIHFTLEDQGNFEIISVPELNKYFRALFTLIISPNAP